MPETPAFLAERLRTEGEKTAAFFADLTPDQWNSEIYTEGEIWTIRNILAHFVTSERAFISLFTSICAGGSGVSEDFDIDRYNAGQQKKTRELTPAELLEQFKDIRAQMTNFVASLTDADLSKQGRHPFLGQSTLAEMIKMVYRHNQIHYRDLRKVIGEI
jgi:uncharacterized damage-inducible protein DinB